MLLRWLWVWSCRWCCEVQTERPSSNPIHWKFRSDRLLSRHAARMILGHSTVSDLLSPSGFCHYFSVFRSLLRKFSVTSPTFQRQNAVSACNVASSLHCSAGRRLSARQDGRQSHRREGEDRFRQGHSAGRQCHSRRYSETPAVILILVRTRWTTKTHSCTLFSCDHTKQFAAEISIYLQKVFIFNFKVEINFLGIFTAFQSVQRVK